MSGIEGTALALGLGLGLWALLLLPWLGRLAAMKAPPAAWLFPVLPLLLGGLLAWWPAAARNPGIAAWIEGALFIWAAVTLVWLLSLVKRDSSIMDVAYGAVLAALPWWLYLRSGLPASAQSWLLLGLASLGFGRNSLYILWRNLPHGEDPRYARWRARHGAAWWWWSYFQVFALQGVLLWIWSLPLVLALFAGGAIGWTSAIGAALWTIGFVFEAGGDWQLARFRARRREKAEVLDRGLWSLTRHPNYFGHAAMWCGYALLALAHPWGAWGLPVAAWVSWFMWRGSATSMTEQYLRKTKPAYADYCTRVPEFLPRPIGRVQR